MTLDAAPEPRPVSPRFRRGAGGPRGRLRRAPLVLLAPRSRAHGVRDGGFVITRRLGRVRVPLDARHDRDGRLDPRSTETRRRGPQGRPRGARRGYALLRSGDDHGAVRRRASRGTASVTGEASHGRLARTTTTSSAASAASAARSPATCSRPGSRSSSSTSTPTIATIADEIGRSVHRGLAVG